jgi:hypothetical protein
MFGSVASEKTLDSPLVALLEIRYLAELLLGGFLFVLQAMPKEGMLKLNLALLGLAEALGRAPMGLVLGHL